MTGFGAGMTGWGLVWPVLLVTGLAALVFGLVRARPSRGDRGAGDRAREILRERYARGEITEDELRARMRTLDER